MTGQVARAGRIDGRDPPQTVAPALQQPLARPLPLVVDLDRALPEGVAWEIALAALRARPGRIGSIAWAVVRGEGATARLLADVPEAATSVPLAAPLRDALARGAHEGRRVVLLTARHAPLAEALTQAHASIAAVVTVAQDDPFADLSRLAAIRQSCPTGFVVLPDEDAPWARSAASLPPQDVPVARPKSRLRIWARALRLHQWAKNLLVFVPPVLAGQAWSGAAWLTAACAFLAFGLTASATYLLNDLHDLDHDRAHRSKRNRPLAAGRLAIPHALAAAGLGLGVAGGLATLVGPAGMATLAAYLGLTLAYTFGIKRLVVLDAVTLAGLFTLRLVGGIAFCGVAGSAWLLAFSMVVFSGLALAKRFVEIEALKASGTHIIAGRGYTSQDGPAVLALGAGASTSAVLILSLYIVETSARNPFYAQPDWLWAAPVALFVWLGRVWILCGRGALRDDPVEFALSDRPSLALGLVILSSFALACLRF